MRAGELKYRLEVLRPLKGGNGFGERVAGYESVGVIRAERVKISGTRIHEAAEMFADYRVEFNIRDAHLVEEHWHVRQLGGYEYVVTSVIPNIDRGMKTLVCERFNQ